MKKAVKILFCLFAVVFVSSLFINPVKGAEVMVQPCAQYPQLDEDELPAGSILRIYMPPPQIGYNGRFIIWAYGFQDVTDDPGISDDQLCFSDFCIPDVVVGLGFGFGVIYYGKTGLAVKEGKAKIIHLVKKLRKKGKICNVDKDLVKVYIIGASEGGLITTLLAEQNPKELFDASYALCGPIGDFPLQINYLGDARVTFEYFFPNEIPGYKIFNNNSEMPPKWDEYFEDEILPLFIAHPLKAKQWFKVAKLPYDPSDYITTVVNSAKDVLRYSVINLPDAVEVLGGQPFDNRWKWYSGSYNDFRLNLKVKRFRADSDAVDEMRDHYNTSGKLEIPLITMHTKRDQQVPYWHEIFYNLKTISKGSFLTDHFNIPIDRYGHCDFTLEEALGGFAMMLLYAGDWEMLTALETFMQAQQLEF
ncbi:MAG: hypothetical protein PVF14_21310 [Desulfobacterales bacterium]|jgi:pimeloyl-ACP methyl ester carboxylesterase